MLKSVGTAAAMLIASHAAFAQSGPGEVQFDLEPNPAFLRCLSPGVPTAHVDVRRGNLNDTLILRVSGLKPNLQFDMFTVQRSPLDADGKPVANFKGFGLAWYQSDIEADQDGEAKSRSKQSCWIRSSVSMPIQSRHPIRRRPCCRPPTRSILASGSTTQAMRCRVGLISTSRRRSMVNIKQAHWR